MLFSKPKLLFITAMAFLCIEQINCLYCWTKIIQQRALKYFLSFYCSRKHHASSEYSWILDRVNLISLLNLLCHFIARNILAQTQKLNTKPKNSKISIQHFTISNTQIQAQKTFYLQFTNTNILCMVWLNGFNNQLALSVLFHELL